MDKVRKFAKLAYIAHEDFYKTFSDVWYPDQVIEKSIEILGNRFLLNNKATVNRDIDFRKRIWDPRNYEMP